MGSRTEELKQVAQIRKAVAPLIGLLKREADTDFTKRLDTIESALEALLKKDSHIEVKAPEVTVKVPADELAAAVAKSTEATMKKYDAPTPTPYEPHDQMKKGVYQYSGFVKSDGAWYIQRVTKGEQRYAKGTGGYAKAWNDIENLTYGYIDAA